MKKNDGTTGKTGLPTSLSPEAYAEELRKTVKNVSVRMSEDQAAILIYLDVECGISKARVIKDCMDRSLVHVCRERLKNLQALAALPDLLNSLERGGSPHNENSDVSEGVALAVAKSGKRGAASRRR